MAESLYDALNVAPPVDHKEPEEPSITSLARLTGKKFAEAVLNSVEFRRYIIQGLVLGDLPSAILGKLMDHGWGAPVQRVEVKDTSEDYDTQSIDALERRALFLSELARSLRQTQEAQRLDDSDSETPPLLH